MSDTRTLITQRVHQHGAAHVARVLDVSRSALLGYVAGAAREATRLIIEQRVERLGTPEPGA
jgi:hypothetical protein